MTTETDRLNRIGAEIMQFKIPLKNGYGYAKDGVWTGFATKKLADEHYVFDDNENKCHPSWWYLVAFKGIWSPATDLNHNAMVMDTFDSWEIYKMGGYGRQKRIYTCKIWETTTPIIGQADTEALARARAYEKAWEVEKE